MHIAPVAHRTMLLCKNMPAMKTDTVPKRSVVRSSFMRTAAVSTNIMAMVKKNILIYAGDLDLNGITTVLYSQLHELDLPVIIILFLSVHCT